MEKIRCGEPSLESIGFGEGRVEGEPKLGKLSVGAPSLGDAELKKCRSWRMRNPRNTEIGKRCFMESAEVRRNLHLEEAGFGLNPDGGMEEWEETRRGGRNPTRPGSGSSSAPQRCVGTRRPRARIWAVRHRMWGSDPSPSLRPNRGRSPLCRGAEFGAQGRLRPAARRRTVLPAPRRGAQDPHPEAQRRQPPLLGGFQPNR